MLSTSVDSFSSALFRQLQWIVHVEDTTIAGFRFSFRKMRCLTGYHGSLKVDRKHSRIARLSPPHISIIRFYLACSAQAHWPYAAIAVSSAGCDSLSASGGSIGSRSRPKAECSLDTKQQSDSRSRVRVLTLIEGTRVYGCLIQLKTQSASCYYGHSGPAGSWRPPSSTRMLTIPSRSRSMVLLTTYGI